VSERAPAATIPERYRAAPGARVPRSGAATTVIAVIATLIMLRLAREVLIPVALAALVALFLTPFVRRLERVGLRPGLAATIATLLAGAAALGLGWVLLQQVADLAEQLPLYRRNLLERSASLGAAGEHLRSAWDAVHRLGAEMVLEEEARTGGTILPDATPVRVIDPPLTPLRAIGHVLFPAAALFGGAAIVLVLCGFLLAYRRDLGDRLVHVFGTTRVHVTQQTMEDAAENVSRYLRVMSLVNLGFGAAVAAGLWALGVPNAVLWGALAGIFRFIPFVGQWLGAAGPVLLCLGMSDTWTKAIVLVASWTVVDGVLSNLIEPWLYGKRTVVSPVGVMFGALAWTVLWGPAGLILAVPMTVSLVVLSKALPRLTFLDVLIGQGTSLEPRVQLYHRLLATDPDAALALIDAQRKDASLTEVADTLVLPALVLAETDRDAGHLDEARSAGLMENVRAVVEDLADGGVEPAEDQASRVFLVPIGGEADDVTALLLEACLARRGVRAEPVPAFTPRQEKVRLTCCDEATVVCVSVLPPGSVGSARSFVRRLRAARPDARIVVGLWTSEDDPAELADRLGNGVDVVTTFADAEERILAWATEREGSAPG
jgi:predicted PurR-regulated permease PerM